jgi:hypothetical protein
MGFDLEIKYGQSMNSDLILESWGADLDKWTSIMMGEIIQSISSIETIIVFEGVTRTPELSRIKNSLTRIAAVNNPILLREAWPGGYVIHHDGSRAERVAADRVVEFLAPIERVVSAQALVATSGPFARPVGVDGYVLSVEDDAVLPAMIGDTCLVAVDLSTVRVRRIQSFRHCARLTFARLPSGMEEIPEWAFAGCRELVKADFVECASLGSIGAYAFAGCASLSEVILPPSIKTLGDFSFMASGARLICALDSAVDVGAGAFVGCPMLTEARFGSAKLGQVLFAGCANLRVLRVELLEQCAFRTLGGSSVTSLIVKGTKAVYEKLVEGISPAGEVSFAIDWGNEEREQLRVMTDLFVMSEPCVIEAAHRSLLSSVDLTSLDRLPPGMSFLRCYFLRHARLPRGIRSLPSQMFKECFRLESVNIGELAALQEIGQHAFSYCWMLREIAIPTECRVVILDTSGIRALDLRAVRCDSVDLSN